MSVSHMGGQHVPHRFGGVQPWHRWQDWVNLIVGIWLFTAPYFWKIGASPSAQEYRSEWNAWILGVIVVVMALCSLSAPRQAGSEWINMIAGIWLFIAPWCLGFAAVGHSAAWNQWIVGVIVFILAISAASDARHADTGSGGMSPGA